MDILTVPPHALLKQAPPFLFIDRVIELGDNKIECVKHLAYNEPYFTGHFPDEPIVPGVLIIEMAAQASMILSLSLEGQETAAARIGYLAQTRDFRFFNPGRPGDSLCIKVEMKEQVGNYRTTKALITIGDTNKKAAKGELVFYLPEKDPAGGE